MCESLIFATASGPMWLRACGRQNSLDTSPPTPTPPFPSLLGLGRYRQPIGGGPIPVSGEWQRWGAWPFLPFHVKPCKSLLCACVKEWGTIIVAKSRINKLGCNIQLASTAPHMQPCWKFLKRKRRNISVGFQSIFGLIFLFSHLIPVLGYSTLPTLPRPCFHRAGHELCLYFWSKLFKNIGG